MYDYLIGSIFWFALVSCRFLLVTRRLPLYSYLTQVSLEFSLLSLLRYRNVYPHTALSIAARRLAFEHARSMIRPQSTLDLLNTLNLSRTSLRLWLGQITMLYPGKDVLDVVKGIRPETCLKYTEVGVGSAFCQVSESGRSEGRCERARGRGKLNWAPLRKVQSELDTAPPPLPKLTTFCLISGPYGAPPSVHETLTQDDCALMTS